MFLTHGRGGQRFNSVKNPVRDLSNYRAAKQNRDLFRKLYMIYEKRTIPHAAVGTDAYGFFVLQARRNPACCVVNRANHPVIKTVWDRTARRPTSRSVLSDARPAWAYGFPQQKQRLCFPHCPLLTYPHHGHIVPHRQGR